MNNDSFFPQEEERELAEFEMLERAALESSFSSQCSLITRLLGASGGNLSSSPKQAESVAGVRRSPLQVRALRGQQVMATSKTTRERSPSLTPVLEDRGFQEDGSSRQSSTPACSEPRGVQLSSPACSHANRTASPKKLALVGWGIRSDEQRDLDSTLKPLPLTAAGEFSDEEAWESSTCGTPIRPTSLSRSSSSSSCSSSACSSERASPSPTVAALQERFPLQAPAPVRKVKVLPGSPLVVGPLSNHSSLRTYQPLKPEASHVIPDPVLPPPSALVDKLFPSLKKGRLPRQPVGTVEQTPQGPVESRGAAVSSAGVPSLAGDDGGFGDQVRQVREKLVQLENEIEWYKSRNTALERLRVEREKVRVGAHLAVAVLCGDCLSQDVVVRMQIHLCRHCSS